jgi:DNA-binding XRE family transcriptional regulator
MKKHECTPVVCYLFDIKQYQCGCGKYFTEDEIGHYLNRMIGLTIKLIRVYFGWSQKTLACELCVSHQRIQFIESGKANLTLNTIEKISSVFGINFYSFMSITLNGLTPWQHEIGESFDWLRRHETLQTVE